MRAVLRENPERIEFSRVKHDDDSSAKGSSSYVFALCCHVPKELKLHTREGTNDTPSPSLLLRRRPSPSLDVFCQVGGVPVLPSWSAGRQSMLLNRRDVTLVLPQHEEKKLPGKESSCLCLLLRSLFFFVTAFSSLRWPMCQDRHRRQEPKKKRRGKAWCPVIPILQCSLACFAFSFFSALLALLAWFSSVLSVSLRRPTPLSF